MSNASIEIDDDVYHQIALGIRAAGEQHYTIAATHFSIACSRDSLADSVLGSALRGFLTSHRAYWQAQQTFHNAGLQFAAAYQDQQISLQAIAELFSAVSPLQGPSDPGDRHPPCEPVSPMLATRAGGGAPLPCLSITCFGSFQVRRDGAALALCPSRNGQALLRLLVSRPRYSVSGEEVMDMFWPECDPSTARHKLHIAVSALRCSLNAGLEDVRSGGYIICDAGVYRLNPTTVHTDVEDFLAAYEAGRSCAGAAAAAHYQRACDLYTGAFLAEDRYADWAIVRREQLTQTYLHMCEALGAQALAAGAPDEALLWAGRVLAENRCDEAAHRLAMSAYVAAGRRTDALRQYQRCAAFLRHEMDIEPDAPTEALLQHILGAAERP